MAAAPPTFPVSVASFYSNTYTFDPLYAYDTISQSANIAGGLGVLKRGTVLFGPVSPAPITNATLLTTVPTGASARVILAQDIDTTGGQVTGLVYTQGRFLDTAMTFSSNGAASDAASLWDYGVYVLTVLQRSGTLVPMMKLPATGGPLPQSMGVKDAKKATQDEVTAIKNAIAAFNPLNTTKPAVPPIPGVEPAWAVAAFGEPKPTAEQQAKEKAAESTDELATKQNEDLKKLSDEYEKQLSELAQKQAKERADLEKKNADALAAAEKKDAQNAHQEPPPPPERTKPR